jgi:phosphoenolpyruvate carboxykinase (GTP)
MATPVERWVEEQERIYKPKRVYWCDGTEAEAHRLIEAGITEEKIGSQPVFTALNQTNWPDSYLHHSHPTDVARTEQLTFVCHPEKEQSGPNNNWMAPDKAKAMMTKLADGAMKGRTMYVLPYMMGHPDSPYAKACVQVTDTSYVAVSMRIMTRMGHDALKRIGTSERFVKGSHSIGDLSPDRRFIMHFPQEGFVWSLGSGYGGNALLGKKCFALRVASYLGLRQGWLAEHMLIMGIEDMKGRITYITAAMPSACGKTNLAMLQSALPEYRVFTVGDDIAWMNVGPDGRLYAINPEAGFFGVAPGTSMKTNPNMIRTLKGRNFYPILYTNVGRDVDTNEPWWEGLDGPPPHMEDWQGRPWKPGSKEKIAHPNSRFTVSLYNCPTLSKEFDNPNGVPISAILIGGRRSHLMPLVVESFDWSHGVFMGARTGSETTAAAAGAVGVLRRDPFAMLPFCGYNMGDYFRHWMDTGALMRNPPKIFAVNWFRVDDNGKFVWPGFGDNMRVLKWILDRVDGKVGAHETPIGLVPHMDDFNMEGLPIPRSKMDKLFEVRPPEWKGEVRDIKKFFDGFGRTIPFELRTNLDQMEKALKL